MQDEAIVIGVERYPGHSDLHGSENDAREFASWLNSADGGGFLGARAVKPILSSDFSPATTYVDARPMSEDIHAHFRALVNRSQTQGRIGERIFIFFAGHGIASTQTTGAAGFVWANSDPFTTMSTDVLQYADWFVRKGSFNEVIFIFDCCRAIQPTARPVPPMLPEIMPVGAKVRTFRAFAARYGHLARERSFPPTNVVHGYFTRALLDALKDARPNAGYRVTGSAIKAFIHNRIGHFATTWNDVPDPDITADDAFDVTFCLRQRTPTCALRLNLRHELVGRSVTLEDGHRVAIAGTPIAATASPLLFDVPAGIYKVIIDGADSRIIDVTGDINVEF